MIERIFFDNLKKRFNYNDKTIKALSLILPKLIAYYGNEYKDIVLSALLNCEIIPCASDDTINMVLNRLERKNISFHNELDLKKGQCIYSSSVSLKYNEIKNIYEIDEIDRVIITSHTFNFDSLKGLEVLTHSLCHLIKSYGNEFIISENILTVKSGLSYKKYKILYDNGNISFDFISEFGNALEEGFTIYDTEKIVASIYDTNYKCYDFDSIYKIATVLKGSYNLKDQINTYEIFGDHDIFINKYGEDNIMKLDSISSEAVEIENEMLLTYTKEDKDVLKDLLDNKINNDAYDNLIDIYKYKNVVRT